MAVEFLEKNTNETSVQESNGNSPINQGGPRKKQPLPSHAKFKGLSPKIDQKNCFEVPVAIQTTEANLDTECGEINEEDEAESPENFSDVYFEDEKLDTINGITPPKKTQVNQLKILNKKGYIKTKLPDTLKSKKQDSCNVSSPEIRCNPIKR